MQISTEQERRTLEQLDRGALERLQTERLNQLLEEVLPHNAFYAGKFKDSPTRLESLEDLQQLPFTSKDELLPDGHGEEARNRTYPIEEYVRFHQTSGTRGRPMSVLDTAADWGWWIDGWQFVLDAAAVTPADRAMMAFSFGPFIGFWSAFDAVVARGALAVPAGGMSSTQRLDLIERTRANVLMCTPNYAMRLAKIGRENSVSVDKLPIEKVIVAGEPGGSVPAIRERIEEAWQARLIDHSGATEIGPWGYGPPEGDARDGRGLYVNESMFIAEFLSIDSGKPAQEGELAHLVLTTLGRSGRPVIRYRTGDLVRPVWSGEREGGARFVFLEGGVIGRADDMMIIRGVNIFPSAIDQILHGFPEVVEYQMIVRKKGEMDELVIEVEDHLQNPGRIARELELRLGLRIDVRLAPAMSLPRYDGKARRFVDRR